MGVALELPPELLEFLKVPPPQSLVIRGPAGTGKTMLALELLNSFGPDGVYVSCRVPKSGLDRAFPWMHASENPIRTVDCTGSAPGIHSVDEMFRYARKVMVEPESSDDVRALWLPAAILEEWSRVDPARRSMLVIDSWDALVERYLGPSDTPGDRVPDRAEIERILLDLMSRAPIHLVLVTEKSEPTQLDYLVNGVVSTRWERVDSRRERWLTLEKLRGVRIDNPEYPFTLDGGRFTCITPAPPGYSPHPLLVAGLADARPGYIWPGSADYRAAFGELPMPGVTLFELDGPVPYDAVRVVYGPMQTGAVQRGGRVVHFTAPGVAPSHALDPYRSVFSTEQIRQSVRIASATQPSDEQVRQLILPLPDPRGAPMKPRFDEAWRFMDETPPGSPRLAVVWLAGLRALGNAIGFTYDPLIFPALTANVIEQSGVHFVYVGETADPLAQRLAPIASRHIRFVQRYDRTFLVGINPQTPEFVLTEGDSESPYRLVRVV